MGYNGPGSAAPPSVGGGMPPYATATPPIPGGGGQLPSTKPPEVNKYADMEQKFEICDSEIFICFNFKTR